LDDLVHLYIVYSIAYSIYVYTMYVSANAKISTCQRDLIDSSRSQEIHQHQQYNSSYMEVYLLKYTRQLN
jgi:hypothetical protein